MSDSIEMIEMAELCQRAALEARDEPTIEFYRRAERRWRYMARSRQFWDELANLSTTQFDPTSQSMAQAEPGTD